MKINVKFKNEKNTLKVGIGNNTTYEITKKGTKPFMVKAITGLCDIEEARNTKTISLKNGEKVELGINFTPSDIERVEILKTGENIILRLKEDLIYEIPLEATWSVKEVKTIEEESV